MHHSDRGVSSANWRPCTFAYDSLSRPNSAFNPESGAITYTYDAKGNMPNDGLNSVGYDAETRLLTSNGSNYSYDANGFGYNFGMQADLDLIRERFKVAEQAAKELES